MAHVLLATVPIAGHVQPFLAVARALCSRGHEVSWYTGQKYAQRVQRTGARYVPYRQALDFDDADLERTFPRRAQLSGLAQLKFDLVEVFGAGALGQLADLESLARAPDLVLADPCMFGALLWRERGNVPLVVINVVANNYSSADMAPFGLGVPPSRHLNRARNRVLRWLAQGVLLRDVQAQWRAMRASVGLRTPRFFSDAPFVADAFLQPTVAGLEYPCSDLPANYALIGPLHGEPPEPPPDMSVLRALDCTRPLVHVTQGLTSNARPTLIAPTLAALAREPVEVVVATGGPSAHELGLTPLPRNAHVVPWVSYPELLPRTSLMITNGGYGGVQLALAHGVPLIVWGGSEDKPETAARVAWSGVGLRVHRPTPAALRKAVRRVLADASFATRARALAAEYARTRPVEQVVETCERLLAQRR